MKPRIKKVKGSDCWSCHDDKTVGVGLTPANAYKYWFDELCRLPFGDWNKPLELVNVPRETGYRWGAYPSQRFPGYKWANL